MKRIRKFVSGLLILCMLMSMFPVSVLAEATEIASGSCGENLAWVLNDNGVLTISGTGSMRNYNGSSAPWYEYRDCISEIIIENGITSIGDCSFYDCGSLMSITIPDGVIDVGSRAFYNCWQLTSITLPDSVTYIADSAFYGCGGLTSIAIPVGVTKIQDYTFRQCSNLGSIILPNSITSIGSEAFLGCYSLTSITLPNCITTIGNNAFYGCSSLMNITIPKSVTSIGYSAFKDCSSMEGIWVDIANIDYFSDERGVLYNKAQTFLMQAPGGISGSYLIPDSVTNIGDSAFYNCSKITAITIPESVNNIGDSAFYGCDRLTSITIPKSVTCIEHAAFYKCSSLTSIAISESVTSIGSAAFYGCSSLASITIPESVTCIEDNTFYGCSNLTSITIPEKITSIGFMAFNGCSSLPTIIIPESVISIGTYAFNGCTNLKNVRILNSQCTISDSSSTLGSARKTIIHAEYGSTAEMYAQTYNYTFHAIENGICSVCDLNDEESIREIEGLTIKQMHNNFYVFLGDSHVYNMDAPNSSLYLDLDSISVIDDAVLTPADITWTSSDENIFKVISNGDSSDVYVNLRVEGITEGTATLTATNPDGETISLDVTVVKPNALAFTNIYDTKQYYSSGAFYSAASSISDSVEIFVQFENKQIEGYPCEVEEALVENVSLIEPITLTATVLGSGLSFDRNSYQSTYSATYDAIEFNTGIYDLLMLFPYDTENFETGSSYTVEVTLESDSFTEPVKETYSFTVYYAEKQRVDEHINFIGNNIYKVSKQNIYGTNMLELKDDPEYNWSVVTSLDFDNYYEIVLADLLVDMLDVYQADTIVPTVLKNWHETYDSLLEDVTTMINDSYSDVLDVSELEIDKVLMGGKYTRDGIYADDAIYQMVLETFGNAGNAGKIQSFFATVDETKSAFGIVMLTGDLVSDFVAWGNSIAVLNAFVETDENFKQVFRQVANNIPDSEKKMKEAIEDYLNYSEDFAGQFSEIYDCFCDLGADVALDAFDGIVGEKLWDWAAAKAVGWIGKIPLSGGTATFASTTAYASLTTAIGSVTTGVSLGLCLSDLICDSSDKAAEMSKIIAMSEYAPYIIQALEYYENNLSVAGSNDAVDLFENAFNLHKAAQSYIMEHTVSALEVKADSILQTILGNDDYDELVADILVQKNAIDSMECCGALTNDTIVQTIKVIAIKCPVDVYVYNENGTEIVKIIDDTLESAADGITVYIRDRQKYIALPANQVYTIKIVATDDGMMEYVVCEYNEQMQLHRTIRKSDIPLVSERVFTGEVVSQLDVDEVSYELSYDSEMVGDVNGDGKVNGKDGILLAQYLAEWDVTINMDAADVNGDGKVNGKDGVLLAQYLAEWDVELC